LSSLSFGFSILLKISLFFEHGDKTGEPLTAKTLELAEMEAKYAVGGLNPVPGIIVSGKGSTLIVSDKQQLVFPKVNVLITCLSVLGRGWQGNHRLHLHV
jgi:hypothetical protein